MRYPPKHVSISLRTLRSLYISLGFKPSIVPQSPHIRCWLDSWQSQPEVGSWRLTPEKRSEKVKKAALWLMMRARVLNAKWSVRQPSLRDHQPATDHVCESTEAHRPKSWSSFLHIKDTPTCARLLLRLLFLPSSANLMRIWRLSLVSTFRIRASEMHLRISAGKMSHVDKERIICFEDREQSYTQPYEKVSCNHSSNTTVDVNTEWYSSTDVIVSTPEDGIHRICAWQTCKQASRRSLILNLKQSWRSQCYTLRVWVHGSAVDCGIKSILSSETPSKVQSYGSTNSGMWPPGNSWSAHQSRPIWDLTGGRRRAPALLHAGCLTGCSCPFHIRSPVDRKKILQAWLPASMN